MSGSDRVQLFGGGCQFLGGNVFQVFGCVPASEEARVETLDLREGAAHVFHAVNFVR